MVDPAKPNPYRSPAFGPADHGLMIPAGHVVRMIKGEKVTVENCGMSAREWRELQAAMGLSD